MRLTLRTFVTTGPALVLALLLALPSRAAERAVYAAAIESITSAEAKAHVDALADDTFEGREAGSRGGRAAGNYLVDKLQKLNVVPAGTSGYFQDFSGGPRNILARIEGRDPALKNEFILIGAHYDHVGYGSKRNSYGPWGQIHNGADDNASGTAGLLEIIGAFTELPAPPRRSILFAFWDGEEKGLLGSKHWTGKPTIPLAQIAAAMNLDMIGRLRNGRVEFYGTRTAPGLREVAARANDGMLSLVFPWEMKENSDHHSFFARGIPTVMLHTGLHDNYHRPSDDAHLVNADGIREVARLAFRTAVALADRDDRLAFRSASRSEGPTEKRAAEQTLAPPPARLGISWAIDDPGPGLLITGVVRGGAGERGGLRVGERIIACDGRPVTRDLPLTVVVSGAKSPCEMVLVRNPAREPELVRIALDGQPMRVGISSRMDAAEPGVASVVRLAYGSAADLAGIHAGDRVLEVNGQRFATTEQLDRLLAAAGSTLDLLVERDGKLQSMLVRLP